MGQTLTEKILDDHLVEGELTPGEEIGIEIDQVLTQDTTGTLVWLQFEALGLEEVQTELAAQYCDHQTYQFDFKNTDDHRFLRSAAGTFGAHFSRPGNGICHNVHKENFAAPGKTMLGSDSHTPTPGGLGELAIGSGGLDVAVAMGGGAYYIDMPEVVNVRLEGELPEWATAKDVILELLRRLSVKGGVGKVLEYTGPGVESLTVPERTTITNMGTELGATTSIFPTDEQTEDYLSRVGREDEYVELQPDEDAEYADQITVDLSDLEPLIAQPSMPDNVVPVSEVEGEDVEQVIIGSCTNGAYEDILPAAKMLEGRNVDKTTEMIVAPGSKVASEMLAREGWTAEMMAAGVNFSEATCGACIGIGHVPASDSVSLRTFNRNFEGRSGIEDDSVYLCSPEVATAAALEGEIDEKRDEREDALLAKRRQRAAELVEEELDGAFKGLKDKVRRLSNQKIKETFNTIARKDFTAEINEDFELKIRQDVQGEQAEVAKSTGETQITSLAFIGSLVAIARDQYETNSDSEYFTGGIYPLVMDSPFGALDNTHREEIGRIIPTLANQVVVFATDAQWGGPVEEQMTPYSGQQYWLDFDEGDGEQEYPRTRIQSEQKAVRGD